MTTSSYNYCAQGVAGRAGQYLAADAAAGPGEDRRVQQRSSDDTLKQRNNIIRVEIKRTVTKKTQICRQNVFQVRLSGVRVGSEGAARAACRRLQHMHVIFHGRKWDILLDPKGF